MTTESTRDEFKKLIYKSNPVSGFYNGSSFVLDKPFNGRSSFTASEITPTSNTMGGGLAFWDANTGKWLVVSANPTTGVVSRTILQSARRKPQPITIQELVESIFLWKIPAFIRINRSELRRGFTNSPLTLSQHFSEQIVPYSDFSSFDLINNKSYTRTINDGGIPGFTGTKIANYSDAINRQGFTYTEQYNVTAATWGVTEDIGWTNYFGAVFNPGIPDAEFGIVSFCLPKAGDVSITVTAGGSGTPLITSIDVLQYQTEQWSSTLAASINNSNSNNATLNYNFNAGTWYSISFFHRRTGIPNSSSPTFTLNLSVTVSNSYIDEQFFVQHGTENSILSPAINVENIIFNNNQLAAKHYSVGVLDTVTPEFTVPNSNITGNRFHYLTVEGNNIYLHEKYIATEYTTASPYFRDVDKVRRVRLVRSTNTIDLNTIYSEPAVIPVINSWLSQWTSEYLPNTNTPEPCTNLYINNKRRILQNRIAVNTVLAISSVFDTVSTNEDLLFFLISNNNAKAILPVLKYVDINNTGVSCVGYSTSTTIDSTVATCPLVTTYGENSPQLHLIEATFVLRQ